MGPFILLSFPDMTSGTDTSDNGWMDNAPTTAMNACLTLKVDQQQMYFSNVKMKLMWKQKKIKTKNRNNLSTTTIHYDHTKSTTAAVTLPGKFLHDCFVFPPHCSQVLKDDIQQPRDWYVNTQQARISHAEMS